MSNEQILSFVLLEGPNKLRYRFLRIIYENMLERTVLAF